MNSTSKTSPKKSTFNIVPLCKKSTYSKEELSKKFNGVYISIIKTYKWRWGEFTITLGENDIMEKVLQENPLVINNYSGEFISTVDCCCVSHTVRNLDKLPKDMQKEVLEEIYEDVKNKVLYEEDVLDEYGWSEGDTKYEIYNGFELV